MLIRRKLFITIIFLLLLYLLFRNLFSSLFFKRIERVNIIFYGQTTRYYSFGDDTNYLLPFSADTGVLVPGGYGNYRVGALGKLITLEKKPDLYQKIFSGNSLSFVDFYFFPKNQTIYYGKNNIVNKIPSINEIFFSESNADFYNRLYILIKFLNNSSNQFKVIDDLTQKNESQLRVIDREELGKKYQGLFYKSRYRTEKHNLQIIYQRSYKTASLLSQIIEGEGIRVVDLTPSGTKVESCIVMENKDKNWSQTARSLSDFLKCKLIKGKTEISDIILILGNLEKDWFVN